MEQSIKKQLDLDAKWTESDVFTAYDGFNIICDGSRVCNYSITQIPQSKVTLDLKTSRATIERLIAHWAQQTPHVECKNDIFWAPSDSLIASKSDSETKLKTTPEIKTAIVPEVKAIPAPEVKSTVYTNPAITYRRHFLRSVIVPKADDVKVQTPKQAERIEVVSKSDHEVEVKSDSSIPRVNITTTISTTHVIFNIDVSTPSIRRKYTTSLTLFTAMYLRRMFTCTMREYMATQYPNISSKDLLTHILSVGTPNNLIPASCDVNNWSTCIDSLWHNFIIGISLYMSWNSLNMVVSHYDMDYLFFYPVLLQIKYGIFGNMLQCNGYQKWWRCVICWIQQWYNRMIPQNSDNTIVRSAIVTDNLLMPIYYNLAALRDRQITS